jgi:hypothetical protein
VRRTATKSLKEDTMTPFGLTTIVGLAPRLVLPFSPQHALWLEITGALVVSCVGVLIAAMRSAARDRAARARARKAPGARILPFRRELGGQVG